MRYADFYGSLEDMAPWSFYGHEVPINQHRLEGVCHPRRVHIVGLDIAARSPQNNAGGLGDRVSVQMLPATLPLNPVGIADQAGLVKYRMPHLLLRVRR